MKPLRLDKIECFQHIATERLPLRTEHVDNLNKLAEFLWNADSSIKEHFSMQYFAVKASGENIYLPRLVVKPECGTVCCALGYGPAAGIVSSDPWLMQNWSAYSDNFIPRKHNLRSPEQRMAWSFLFVETWKDYDNQPQGAAQRIWYLLDHGLPTSREEIGRWELTTLTGGKLLYDHLMMRHFGEVAERRRSAAIHGQE